MVYAGIYPEDPGDYEELEKALKKLCLTDGSVSFNYEASAALGSGFRCGFLGMLHLDVFRQRLQDEHEVVALITQPSVTYWCELRNGDRVRVDNPIEVSLCILFNFRLHLQRKLNIGRKRLYQRLL